MLLPTLSRNFSKYDKLTKIIQSNPKPSVPEKTEPTINFKPFTQTVYKASGNIQPYKDFDHPITKPHEIAEVALLNYASRMEDINSPPNAKVLKVGVFGAANSGKSSVFNKLVGRDISAVSNKSFTTNKSILGVKTDLSTNTQLCIYDLPGYPIGSVGLRFYQYEAYKMIEESEIDKLIMIFDSNKTVQKDELKTIDKIRERYANDLDFIMVLNKLDLCYNRRKLYDIISACESVMNFENKIYVSAETDYGIQNLTDHLITQAKPGEWLLPKDYITDLSEVELCHQQIRSIIFNRFFKEFPYEIEIKVVEFLVSHNHIRVGIKLNVERPIHKKIFVGEDGKNLVVLKNHIAKQLMMFYNKFVEVVITVHHGIKDTENIFVTEEAVKNNIKRELEEVRAANKINKSSSK